MNIKAKTKDCHLVVKVRTRFKESIQENEAKHFAQLCLRGFLKPGQIKKNMIEYTGPIGISLHDRLKRPITKREFLMIMEQIVVAVQKLEGNRFRLEYLATDIKNVYINEVTKEVQFIYVPASVSVNQNGVIGLMESIVYSTIPAEENDKDYVSRFIYKIRGLTSFDLNEIEAHIKQEDRSVVNFIRKQNSGQSGFMTDKQRDYWNHYDPSDDQDDEKTGLLDDEEETDLLEEDEDATGLLSEEDDATGLLVEGNEETALLAGNSACVHYPTLYRLLTQETISINKPVFRLGKEQSYVDYFIASNAAVSRSHADLITRNGKYFVKDLNSKNHTYVNGQEISVGCEVELQDGDSLRLANEEFIFHI